MSEFSSMTISQFNVYMYFACVHACEKESCSMFHSSQGWKLLNMLQEYSLGREKWNTAYLTL